MNLLGVGCGLGVEIACDLGVVAMIDEHSRCTKRGRTFQSSKRVTGGVGATAPAGGSYQGSALHSYLCNLYHQHVDESYGVAIYNVSCFFVQVVQFEMDTTTRRETQPTLVDALPSLAGLGLPTRRLGKMQLNLQKNIILSRKVIYSESADYLLDGPCFPTTFAVR